MNRERVTSKINFIRVVFLFGLIFNVWPSNSQDLMPANLFCNHMVLQQGQAVPVWGTAAPHEKITVAFAGQQKTTKSDARGKWTITLDAMQASKNGREMTIIGKDEHIISDVLVGEVWICSGQSNMQFKVGEVPEIKGLIPFAKNIRSFEVKRTVSLIESEDVMGRWSTDNPSSAVAFSFAYFLENLSDVPVGIIHASWGSSSIEAWMPRDMTTKLPHFKKIMQVFDEDSETRNRIQEILDKPDGWSRKDDIFLRRQPNILYNAMMKPLAPYAVKGLVWYQGERNTRYLSGVPEITKDIWFHRVAGMKEYGGILREWIGRYRQEWKNDAMEFMVVMLPGYGKGTFLNPDINPEDPTVSSWAWMRESQMKILELQHTAVANTIDLGDIKNIHPKDKLPIGQRLALLAAKNTLGMDILAKGPRMKKVIVHDNSIEVHFSNADGLKTTNGAKPSGFWLSDESGRWVRAITEIMGSKVLLNSPEMEHPKYVRYAFAGKPKVNLVNKNELPAYPFRTDNFEN